MATLHSAGLRPPSPYEGTPPEQDLVFYYKRADNGPHRVGGIRLWLV